MVEEFLTFAGVPTVGAENGKEALAALRRHRPCLILLDLTMPVMSGWEFRDRQRNLPEPELSDVPVMILSALPEIDAEAKRLGAVEVIRKPIDLDRLVSVVRKFCQPAPAE